MDFNEEILDIEEIRSHIRNGEVVWRDHAMKRIRERKISKDDIRNAIYNGEIIEDRPDDVPTPSCLILGCNVKGRYMHVVCGLLDDMVYIISSYYPDPERWEADMRTRKG